MAPTDSTTTPGSTTNPTSPSNSPGPEDIVGTHKFKDVLYEADEDEKASLKRALTYVKQLPERFVATPAQDIGSREYTTADYAGTVFYHRTLVGNRELQAAFEAAVQADDYNVTFAVDYEANRLTITVKHVGEKGDS